MSYKFRFTIFTPCYNSEKFIHRVIESIESQTFKNFEWLVVNDASTDNTGQILEEYAAKASFPVRIIHNDKNQMLYYNFNIAFKEAKGEFMVFAGHDDRFHPETLQTFDDVWQKYGNDKIAGIWCLCQDQHGTLVGNSFMENHQINNYFEIFEKSIYRQERFGCTRTEVLREYPFDLKSNRLGEVFLWESIGLKYNTIYINKILRTYYIEPDNLLAMTKTSRSKNSVFIFMDYLDWINIYLKQFKFSFKFQLRFHFAFVFYGLLAKIGIKNIFAAINTVKSKILILMLLPFAFVIQTYLGLKDKL